MCFSTTRPSKGSLSSFYGILPAFDFNESRTLQAFPYLLILGRQAQAKFPEQRDV